MARRVLWSRLTASVVGMVVREIGAGHDECVTALDFPGQRQAELAAGLVALISHDDGHQLEVADRALEERKLILEGMLAALARDYMPARGELNQFTAHDLFAEGLVDGDGSERRLVGVAVVDGDEREPVHVRRRDDHDAVIVLALDEGVAVGGHSARELVARVRLDQCLHSAVDRWRRGAGDEIVHHPGELFGIGRVEGTRDRGRSHLSAGAGQWAEQGREEKQESQAPARGPARHA